jgi:hypothetical protein
MRESYHFPVQEERNLARDGLQILVVTLTDSL